MKTKIIFTYEHEGQRVSGSKTFDYVKRYGPNTFNATGMVRAFAWVKENFKHAQIHNILTEEKEVVLPEPVAVVTKVESLPPDSEAKLFVDERVAPPKLPDMPKRHESLIDYLEQFITK